MNSGDPSGMKGFLDEWTMGTKPDAIDGKLSEIESRIGVIDRTISDNIRNPLNAIHSQTTALRQLVSQALTNATSSLEENINTIDRNIQDHAIARLVPLELNTDDAIAAYPVLTTTTRKLIDPLDAPMDLGGIQQCSVDATGNLVCLGDGTTTIGDGTVTNGSGTCVPTAWTVYYSRKGNCYAIFDDCPSDLCRGIFNNFPDTTTGPTFSSLSGAKLWAESNLVGYTDCGSIPCEEGTFTITSTIVCPPECTATCSNLPPPPPPCCPDLTPFEEALGKIADCLCKLAVSSNVQAQSGGDFSFLLSQEGGTEDTSIEDAMGITFDDFDQFANVAEAIAAYRSQWVEGEGT